MPQYLVRPWQVGRASYLIALERKRQIEIEGWTAEHDDEYENGEMLRAAAIYYQNGGGIRIDGTPVPLVIRGDGAPIGWPWHASWWKPKTPHQDLVRAGALCLAERDRLKRKRASFGHVDEKLARIIKAIEAL